MECLLRVVGVLFNGVLEPERVHESEHRVLSMENLGEVMSGGFAPLDESMHFAGDAPQTDAADDG
jgi:hypothetical protein